MQLRTKKKNNNLDTTIMKTKYALIALLAITFFGCDDNTAGLGLGMFPDSDQNLNGKLSTFDVTTESVPTGRIYAKTNIGYVGKFTDNTFGAYNAGFLATLNCPAGTTFDKVYKEADDKATATGSMITSFTDIDEKITDGFTPIYENEDGTGKVIGNCQISIYLWYSSYFGDSLTACRLSIYELNKKKLEIKDNPYYTDIDPTKFYNANSPIVLGTKAYTAVDLSVSDSIRNLSGYVPSVRIHLNKTMTQDLGRRLLEANGADFSNRFNDIFKGIYVKSDYGDGTVLYINEVRMDVRSLRYSTDSITGVKRETKAGKDSITYTGRSFYSTREVIQANQLTNDPQKIAAIIAEGENTYLKTPAGIFTQATLPISAIGEQLHQDTLNAVKLTFSNYNQASDKKFGMSIPSNVLLIRKKYKDSFFEKNQLTDGITSFTTKHLSNTNQYVFSNITNLVNDCLAEREAAEKICKEGIKLQITNSNGEKEEITVYKIADWEKYSDWNKVVLIPVLITYDSSGNGGYGQQPNVIGIQHDLKPGYVKLKGGKLGESLVPAIDFPLTNPDGSTRMVPNPKYALKLEVISTNFGVATK